MNEKILTSRTSVEGSTRRTVFRMKVSWEERKRLVKLERDKAAARALPGLAPEVAADIVEAIHKEIEGADGEGLGAPYDDLAIAAAVYIVKRLGL